MDKLQTVGPDSAGTAVCTAEPESTSVKIDAGNKIEELQKKIDGISAEFKDFVYIISHDLKAPLRAIKALTDWLATITRTNSTPTAKSSSKCSQPGLTG